MHSDLDLIIKKYPHNQDVLRVYAIGDVHVGSEQFDEDAVRKKIEIIRDDPCGVVCLCGDLADYGLKNSKTNVYKATMQPAEQQQFVYELFLPIADKIVACTPGNHEERITKEVGICPMYDLCVLWKVPEVYRENIAITKFSFGSVRGKKQQYVFVGLTSHGSTRNKHKKFIGCFDGIDFAISGHTHTAEYSPHGKIRIDRINATASHVPYKEIVVDANLTPGGYGLKKEYEVTAPPELQFLELRAYADRDPSRTIRKVINYHSISI